MRDSPITTERLSPAAAAIWKWLSENDMPYLHARKSEAIAQLLRLGYLDFVRVSSNGFWIVKLAVRGRTIDEMTGAQ